MFAAAVDCSVTGCKKKAPSRRRHRRRRLPRLPQPPPPAPLAARINNFTAEPRSIERGQSATLRWSVANATDISIDEGLGAVQANGTRQVFPSNTTTYTLTARSCGGNDTRSVTVEVNAPPPPPPPPPPTAENVRDPTC